MFEDSFQLLKWFVDVDVHDATINVQAVGIGKLLMSQEFKVRKVDPPHPISEIDNKLGNRVRK